MEEKQAVCAHALRTKGSVRFSESIVDEMSGIFEFFIHLHEV